MPTPSAVLDALEQAVAARPDQIPLRVHLAELLLNSGEATRALAHLQTVLADVPDDLAALQMAERAARALGDEARAGRYARLTAALGDGAHAAGGAPSQGGSAKPTNPGESSARSVNRDMDAPAPQAPPSPQLGIAAEGAPGLRLVAAGGELVAGAYEKPSITLADIGGLTEVKRRLERSFLAPLRNPQLREYFGKSLRGGLLLYGPPGCGKTFIARAVAGELGARFISVGLTDVLDMWLGNSEKNLHALFEEARRGAPSVLFFDEVDALGRKRTLARGAASRNDVLAQLLTELDGISAQNNGVYVLAATNSPWDVDPALRRPGRLDRALPVLPPDIEARVAILGLHLRGRPVEKVDLAAIAKETELYSGADLSHLCESAAELAMEAAIDSGVPRPIGMKDFENARKQIKPSTRAWFESARPFVQYANEDGVFDDLVAYMRTHRLNG